MIFVIICFILGIGIIIKFDSLGRAKYVADWKVVGSD